MYKAEVSAANLTRKNGASMKFEEIILGDKVEVKGQLWPDNSLNVSVVRNMSLYPHSGTFSGKIINIEPVSSRFTIQKSQGTQVIKTDSLTTYKKNGSSSTFRDLELGMSVKVKGIWERNNADVIAKEVSGNLRLVSIEFTGRMVMKSDSAITVVGANNAMYGVNTTKAKIMSKNNKPILVGELRLDDVLKVSGKHVSGRLEVIAGTIKDNSLVK
jgi:hypothetical protein